MIGGAVLERILLSLPSLIYLGVLRRRGAPAAEASAAVGLRPGPALGYAWAAGATAVTAVLAYAALRLIPASALTARSGVVVSHADSLGGYVGIVLLALAEEMFFRGLLAGLLVRRLGFARGNLVQALVFLAPHCLLLLVSTALWPILPVQLVAGWLLGGSSRSTTTGSTTARTSR